MKKYISYSAIMAAVIALSSCSSDDSAPAISGNGAIDIEFDNVIGANDLILQTQPNLNALGETFKINQLKYIVSNIVLTQADGTTFTYPKSQSYFLVNETNPESQVIHLENVPSGDYVEVGFGIGVDEAQYNLGADGQGDFLALADAADMLWSWSAGYKFVLFEGMFTSASVTSETPFMVHTGKTGTDYNYTSVNLNLPTTALVRNEITPEVHIFADAAKILYGSNPIRLTDHNEGGMGAMIMSGELLPLITENVSHMFSVDHVHND